MKRSLRLSLGAIIIFLPIALAINYLRLSAISQFIPYGSAPVQALGGTPVINFSDPSYAVIENAGSRTINVTLTVSSTQTVQVNYTTQDGTAQAGTDYFAVSGVLVFVPGDRSESFTVTIIDDTVSEPTETLRLVLSNPVNATLGSNFDVPLTITDNDPTPTPTPTSQVVATPVFVDIYEPNNQLNAAYNTATGTSLCVNNNN